MDELDVGFQALVDEDGLDDDAADQLEHAAGTLAKTPPFMARSITSQCHVHPDQVLPFFALARRLARYYGFCLDVDHGEACVVRFSWPDARRDQDDLR